MNSKLFPILCAVASAVVLAPATQGAVDTFVPTPRAAKPGMIKHFGGYVAKPNSGKGKFVFMNAQKKIDRAVVSTVAKKVCDLLQITTVVSDADEVKFMEMGRSLDEAKARAGLIVVDNPDFPMLLVAPEGRWAYVNVAPLVADGAEKPKVEKRLRQELWRGFCYVGGGSPTESGGCCMNAVFNVGGLDAMPWDMISREPVSQVMDHFKRMGITPCEITTYRQACRDGWAPEPTNEFQKAIWTKTRELPTNPLEIKFDPKRDAKK